MVSVRGKGRADKRFKTKPKTLTLAADTPTQVRLKVRKRLLRKIDEEKGKATISATATEAGGQSAADALKVRIKR